MHIENAEILVIKETFPDGESNQGRGGESAKS